MSEYKHAKEHIILDSEGDFRVYTDNAKWRFVFVRCLDQKAEHDFVTLIRDTKWCAVPPIVKARRGSLSNDPLTRRYYISTSPPFDGSSNSRISREFDNPESLLLFLDIVIFG